MQAVKERPEGPVQSPRPWMTERKKRETVPERGLGLVTDWPWSVREREVLGGHIGFWLGAGDYTPGRNEGRGAGWDRWSSHSDLLCLVHLSSSV